MIHPHYLHFSPPIPCQTYCRLAPAPTAPRSLFTKGSSHLLVTKPTGRSEASSDFPFCSTDAADHHSPLIPLLHHHLLAFLPSLFPLWLPLPGSILGMWLFSMLLSSTLLWLVNAIDPYYHFYSSGSSSSLQPRPFF